MVSLEDCAARLSIVLAGVRHRDCAIIRQPRCDPLALDVSRRPSALHDPVTCPVERRNSALRRTEYISPQLASQSYQFQTVGLGDGPRWLQRW